MGQSEQALPHCYYCPMNNLSKAILNAERKQHYKETELHRTLVQGEVSPTSQGSKYKVSHKDDRTVNGIVFDSKQERVRYSELLLMQKAGLITQLELQKEFVLQEAFVYRGEKIQDIAYLADFYYFDTKLKNWTIEEWKVEATRTKDYRIKRKLLLYKYPKVYFREMVSDSYK